ncbi:MAG: hypothetical protein GXP62_17065 [Oligoflexia bacterium]|nr:hypothetical protein [Oligoflexia bacterium]
MITVPLLGLLLNLACDTGYTDASRQFAEPLASRGDFPTEIHEPTDFGILKTPIVDDEGKEKLPAGAACETCHGPEPDPDLYTPPPADENYHTQVEIKHGKLTCYQCHDRDRTKLHLADGTQIEFVDVIALCAQCHGPQYRNYIHDAHGGLNGYWDTSQGAKIRNNCVDCHVPHAPAFKKATPVFRPRDRYLKGRD